MQGDWCGPWISQRCGAGFLRYFLQNIFRRRYGDVILPVQHTCDECVIRLLRRASEWNSDFVFRSCSDVVILPHPDFPSERCGTSRQRRQELDMPDNIPEGVPTDFAETNQAFYNTDTGSMAYTPAPEDDDVTQGETTSADADDLGTTEPSDSGSTTSVTSQVGKWFVGTVLTSNCCSIFILDVTSFRKQRLVLLAVAGSEAMTLKIHFYSTEWTLSEKAVDASATNWSETIRYFSVQYLFIMQWLQPIWANNRIPLTSP